MTQARASTAARAQRDLPSRPVAVAARASNRVDGQKIGQGVDADAVHSRRHGTASG